MVNIWIYMREASGTTARMHFFMSGCFTPMLLATIQGRLLTVCKRHEDEKMRTYGQRIPDIEHGVFTPLVFSTTSGLGRKTQTFYKHLADKLASKHSVDYCTLMGWLRCKISFAILRSAVLCIRGSRSSRHQPHQRCRYSPGLL